MTDKIKKILAKPYNRVLVPYPSGQFYAYLFEFDGCCAKGASLTEAYARLESEAQAWILVRLERGQDIPRPVLGLRYSKWKMMLGTT
jgi:predicted RNase H-like HicB family nuclease